MKLLHFSNDSRALPSKQRLFCALPAENLEKSVVISMSQQFAAQPLTKFSFFEEPRIYFQRLSPLFFGRWPISLPPRPGGLKINPRSAVFCRLSQRSCLSEVGSMPKSCLAAGAMPLRIVAETLCSRLFHGAQMERL
jgi:hypothetical protein